MCVCTCVLRVVYVCVCKFVDVRVYGDVCVLETNFIRCYSSFHRYLTLLEVSRASRLVESPCDPFLQFHMHTHHWPADLAEASHW